MAEHAHHDVDYVKAKKGLMSWLITLDHKRIGILYLITTFLFFLVGGLFAMFVRMELFAPGNGFAPDTYNKFFTLHGVVMTFLFIIPVIPGALGNFFLPMMIGAKDVVFPRLNLLSYYIYIVGSLLLVATLFLGGVDTGWTIYTPYSDKDMDPTIILATLGIFINGFSGILTGLNFIVTLHKLKIKGIKFSNMPLFLWAIYATAIIQVLATPVVGVTVLLLLMESLFNIGFFDPALGGDPVLFQHFFWFYSHPAVYIMILPAMGIISEIITVFSRKHIFGYKAIAYSSLAIAFISFLVWGHHMFATQMSPLATKLFSFLTMLVAIPTAIKVFNWIATLYGGSIRLATPMLYVLIFLLLFTIGGLTGLPLAAVLTDIHLHDGYFVVAHFHYVMLGGTGIGFIAGVHYWWPKMIGKMYPEKLAQFCAVIVFISFNLTFFPQFILGKVGMPRRYADYPAEYTLLNQISSVGALVLGVTFCVIVAYLVWSVFWGKKASANPWGAKTLEWTVSSPPPEHNFVEDPVYEGDFYDFSTEDQKKV